jgi:hypothetical protein
VTDVEIEYQTERVLNTNWTLHVYTCEGANMERIQYAINATRHSCGTGTNCGRNCPLEFEREG